MRTVTRFCTKCNCPLTVWARDRFVHCADLAGSLLTSHSMICTSKMLPLCAVALMDSAHDISCRLTSIPYCGLTAASSSRCRSMLAWITALTLSQYLQLGCMKIVMQPIFAQCSCLHRAPTANSSTAQALMKWLLGLALDTTQGCEFSLGFGCESPSCKAQQAVSEDPPLIATAHRSTCLCFAPPEELQCRVLHKKHQFNQ